jgi:phosphatidylserine/phosphatidylglycerophosphate/cardiolipin synthase-like enzyme
MSTKALEEFLSLADDVAKMKALAARYQAAARKDAAVVVNLNLVIDATSIPASEAATLQRAVAERVRLTLPAIVAAAIAQQETALAALKTKARQEYAALFS